MKTKGEIEAEISRAIVQFEIDYMGRGPKETRTHIVEDLVVVRLKGVLTPAEEQLTKSIDGKELVKKMRATLIDKARPFCIRSLAISLALRFSICIPTSAPNPVNGSLSFPWITTCRNP